MTETVHVIQDGEHVLGNPPGSPPQLQKVVGAGQFFTLAFGAIIGVGWVVVLGEWLGQAGPIGSILAFVGGGLIMMLVGLCYAEMATAFPAAGGEVVYTYEAFGLPTSFATGWLLCLVYISVTVFESVSVGWVVGTIAPGIQGAVLYHVGGDQVRLGSLLLGLGGTALLTYFSFRGAGSAARFQDVFTYGLLALSLAFIAAGVLFGEIENLEPLFGERTSGSILGGVLAVFVTAPFWFAGFNVIPQVIEEKAPGTSLRLAGRMIVLSIGLAIVFYSLIILSSSMAAPWRSLIGLELAAAGAFESAFNSPTMATLVLIAALLGLITTWNTVFISAARVLFSLGRARIIYPVFGRVHPVFGSPATAILFVGAISFAGTFLGRSAILPIVSIAGTCLAFAFFLTCLGVLKLRYSAPTMRRPYRVPGGKFMIFIITFISLFLLILSLYQPYANSERAIPTEWIVLLVWGVIGAAFWLRGRNIRSSITERERRDFILGSSVVQE